MDSNRRKGKVAFSRLAVALTVIALVVTAIIVAPLLLDWGRRLAAASNQTNGPAVTPIELAETAEPIVPNATTTKPAVAAADNSPTSTPSPTPTAANTSTPTPTATATVTPLPPLPATYTPQPSLEPSATPVPPPFAVINVSFLYVRLGPSVDYPALALVTEGIQYDIVGRLLDSSWWQVCCVNGAYGWVNEKGVNVQGDVDAVRVAIDIPPLPTVEP